MSRDGKLIAALLVINALLLVGVLWVQLAETPLLAAPAHAQRSDLPNAGAQRIQMMQIMDRQRQSIDEIRNILKSGQVRVVITQPAPAGTQQPSGTRRR